MKYTEKYWKVINNFKNIKNMRYGVNCYGDVKNLETGEILKKKIANKKRHPYYAVYLLNNDNKKEWVLVHQLVAKFFVKIPKYLNSCNDIVPDHLDNNGLNNFYKNLQWKTRSQNISDAFKMGYIDNSGEKHRDVFITEKQAEKICKYLEKGLDYNNILNKMGFKNNKKYRSLLVRIKNGLAWKKVSSKYNIDKNKIKYTDKQKDALIKLPMILKLHEKGYSTKEIFQIVYKNNSCNKATKMNIIRRICKQEIFKKEISEIKDKRSTTIES